MKNMMKSVNILEGLIIMKIKVKRIDDGEILEFLSFNFDGQGNNLVYNHESEKLELYSREETKNVLFGENVPDFGKDR